MESDAQRIARFLEGDEKVHREIDQWIAGAARPYRSKLGATKWDDTLQELRLEVVRLLRKESFRGESKLSTFIWRVVNNRCLNQLRQARKWQWADLETIDHQANERLSLRLAGFEEVELRDLMLRVLESMSEECRRLWSMLVEGFSYGEMAERLKVKEGTLRVRVRRCRMRAIERRDELGQSPVGARQ